MSSIERRAYLRYKIRVSVFIQSSDGVQYETVTRDISLGGMQVECDASMLKNLLPKELETAPSDQVRLQVELNFSDSSESIPLNAQVQGVLRMAESEYSIRFSFIDVDQMQLDQLQRLLN